MIDTNIWLKIYIFSCFANSGKWYIINRVKQENFNKAVEAINGLQTDRLILGGCFTYNYIIAFNIKGRFYHVYICFIKL